MLKKKIHEIYVPISLTRKFLNLVRKFLKNILIDPQFIYGCEIFRNIFKNREIFKNIFKSLKYLAQIALNLFSSLVEKSWNIFIKTPIFIFRWDSLKNLRVSFKNTVKNHRLIAGKTLKIHDIYTAKIFIRQGSP